MERGWSDGHQTELGAMPGLSRYIAFKVCANNFLKSGR